MMATAMRMFVASVAGLGLAIAWLLSGRVGWPLAVLASAVLAVLIHALIMAVGFVLAWIRSGSEAPARWGWLRALPGEVRISMRNMYLDLPWLSRWPARLPSSSRGAVLLVHGYGCNRGIWRGVDRWLADADWAVDAPNLEPPHGDIDAFGLQVAAAARDLCARSGHGAVVVVAHSMGGLATRAALRQDPSVPIAHVVTIGTPHHGTWHARFGRGVCATQMMPECAWLATLLAAEQTGSAQRFTCMASRHDNVVSPASRALLAGARSLVVDDVGHMALLFDPRVRAALETRLAEVCQTP